MQKVTYITMRFIPAQKTKDDPLGERAYFHWQADIAGKKWGKVTELKGDPRGPLDISIEEFRRLALQSLDEMEAVRRMSSEEMTEAEAARPRAAVSPFWA